MKLIYDGREIYELSDTQKKVIQNDIPTELFESDMLRRCKYWLTHPAEREAELGADGKREALKSRGRATLPSSFMGLAEEHADEFPVRLGYSDITAIQCSVGEQSFEFPVAHQKILRKLKENDQQGKSIGVYALEEQKFYEDSMRWIIQHKYERCLERLKKEWLPKLEERGITEVAADDQELAELIFAQPDYKNRSQREEEAEINS